MKLTLILIVVIGGIFFIGISIAGSASRYFVDVAEKKSNLVFSGGMTAYQFARTVCAKENLNLEICKTKTKYGDHYSHKRKHIAISEDFINSDSLVANAIVAHEIGHAITDKKNNFTYRFHYFLGKVTRFLNMFFYVLLIATLVLYLFFKHLSAYYTTMFYIAVATVGLSLLFKVVTISNEKLASKIGAELLKEYGASRKELRAAKAVYRAALTTYVGALFMPIVKVINFILDIIYKVFGKLFR